MNTITEQKAVLVVTDPTLFRKAEIPTEEIAEVFEDDEPVCDRIPPSFCAQCTPIQIPARLVSWFDRSKWRLAMHESGHALAALLFDGYCKGVALVDTGDSGEGHAYTGEPDGLPTVRVCLAGLAAERLVEGGPLEVSFFDSDIKHAREALIDTGVHEEDADAGLQRYYEELHRTFAEGWVRALRDLADALFGRGFLHGDAVASIVGRAQARLTKCHGVAREYIDRVDYTPPAPLNKSSSEFDQLAADMKMLKAHELDAAADKPGLSAHDVAVLEAQRNRVAARAAAIRRGEK